MILCIKFPVVNLRNISTGGSYVQVDSDINVIMWSLCAIVSKLLLHICSVELGLCASSKVCIGVSAN